MKIITTLLVNIFITGLLTSYAQFNFENQIEKKEITKEIIDPTYGITLYEPLNMYLHSDSTRIEEGYAVNGWKEDHYSTGEIAHKGYYIEGQLKVYKNFYPNGNIERNFKAIDSFKSRLTLFYPNGNIKSKVSYSNDFAMEWTDYNENGDISFYEKYNKDKLSHEQKVFYYDSGNKKDELIIDQKKKKTYIYTEYHENGSVKLKGHLKYDMGVYDYVKYGTWHHYDDLGGNHKKDHY